MLIGIGFGKYYFKTAVILRDALLVSSLLSNSEAWYNISKENMNQLEAIDLLLLRQILNAPHSTPKEMIYLELGCIPLKDMIKQRRINVLHYILHENTNSLIHKVLIAQLQNPTSKDWGTTVIKDIRDLNLNVTIADISNIPRTMFKNTIRESIRSYSFNNLQIIKEKHTKVNHINHTQLQMQNYLMPNAEISKQISQLMV